MLKRLKKLVKDLLAITWIRTVYEKSTLAILNMFAMNRLFATVYSLITFPTFNREQYATLRGRRDYYRNLTRKRKSHVELRRNIHRLEKGIIMQPRRPIFARDYIDETIGFYEQLISQYEADKNSVDQSELEWSHDVLKEYFSLSAADDRIVNSARKRYERTLQNFTYERKVEKAPYTRNDVKKSSITYDELLGLAMQRRSVRWFSSKKVPRDKVDKALLVGRQSPTACNRLPYEFRVFDEPDLVKRVAGLPFGAAGYAHQIPTIVVVVGKLESYFSPRDRHAIYVDSSLATMSFMLALETQGLSSSVINWPDFEPLELKAQKMLNLKVSERIIMMIAVGYAAPNGGIPFSQKKSLEVLRTYNKLSSK
jgi:nitroreductase